MAKIIIRLPRYATIKEEKRVVAKKREWYVRNIDEPFYTEFGQIPPEILKKNGLHKIGKEEICIFEAQPIDDYKRLKREVQLITLKDLGFIAAYTGIDSNTIIGEAGSGSGGATCFFSRIARKVYSYDIRGESIMRVGKECERMGLKNVELNKGDVTNPDEINCKVDLFLLDVPEPWNAWGTMTKIVKTGGWVVGYTPNANQLQEFINKAPKEFMKDHSCEIIERHWRVQGKVCRPETADFSHTAFLSFFRRIY